LTFFGIYMLWSKQHQLRLFCTRTFGLTSPPEKQNNF
jgi:hypothetical protein